MASGLGGWRRTWLADGGPRSTTIRGAKGRRLGVFHGSSATRCGAKAESRGGAKRGARWERAFGLMVGLPQKIRARRWMAHVGGCRNRGAVEKWWAAPVRQGTTGWRSQGGDGRCRQAVWVHAFRNLVAPGGPWPVQRGAGPHNSMGQAHITLFL
jgi:hypothetical protein